MKLSYGTLISPAPIKLEGIGSIRKPTLAEIADTTFEKFNYYEAFLKMDTEHLYCSGIFGDKGKALWDALSDEQKETITLYSTIKSIPHIQSIYVDILDFFFEGMVIYKADSFVILKEGTDIDKLQDEDIIGIITENTFQEVLEIIQQTCCIYTKPKESIEDLKFKNALARKMYERMKKAQEEQERLKAKKNAKLYSIPNIISAVASMHPNLNLSNIWGLTVFQLIDHFNRLQTNEVYDINKTRVSVWGDEKKTFDPTMWYKALEENDT